MQLQLFDEPGYTTESYKSQLLKWIGNKQRFAHKIISYFPRDFGTYFEPFLGSGGVLATLAPKKAVAADVLAPLIQIFATLQASPETVKLWYSERWNLTMCGNKKDVYEDIKASYNANPNPADLLFLSRSCYGGVVRFRQNDGYMSTPLGVHTPISPESFGRRVDEWHKRIVGTAFFHQSYEETMEHARPGDMIYCDPPYCHSQAILYGAQSFKLVEFLSEIAKCKERGVNVALSIDGTKRSGNFICDIPIPEDLFEREIFVNVGRSMLKRFQMNGKTLEGEDVRDRLLLTY